jgi:hypothetical protein
MHPREAPAAQEFAMQSPAQQSVVWEARLVHGEPGRRVVEVSGWRGGQCLGRCLGEAEDAETAEDRAIARLSQRLAGLQDTTERPASQPRQALIRHSASEAIEEATEATSETTSEAASEPATEQTSPQKPAPPAPAAAPPAPPATAPLPQQPQLPQLPVEPAADPDDWSEELAELDVQLQRLGWDRSQESIYLQRAFGHPSRNRLTAYADLAAYLRAVRGLNPGSSPESAAIPLRRSELLSQCEQLLASLGWDAGRGRQFLEQHFQLASRQQLGDEQLLQFNMLLEEQLIGFGSAPAAAASPG